MEPTSTAAIPDGIEPQQHPAEAAPFDAFALLARALSLCANNFLPIVVAAIVADLPYATFHALTVRSQNGPVFMLGELLAPMLSAPLWATLVVATAQVERGHRIDLLACVRTVARRAHVVVAVAVLSSIATFASFAACLVPAIFIVPMIYVLESAVLFEDAGVVTAFRRSEALTRGRRVACFILIVVPASISLGATIIVAALPALPQPMTLGLPIAASLLAMVFGRVASTLAYLDLVADKDPRFRGAGIDRVVAKLAP